MGEHCLDEPADGLGGRQAVEERAAEQVDEAIEAEARAAGFAALGGTVGVEEDVVAALERHLVDGRVRAAEPDR